jgi:hypothetical protein
MFINPMGDSESQRIGEQKCTPLGYRLRTASDLREKPRKRLDGPR